MCAGPPERTVGSMIITSPTHRIRAAVGVAIAALCALALWPAAGHAAGHVKTFRIFSKAVSITVTHPDGTVISQPPFPEMAPGDVLDVYSLDFKGNHKHHAKRPLGSEHLQCVFGTGEPTCVSHVAIGGSLMVFGGNPGTLIGGTGRFQGATGHVVSSKEVPGGTDAVAKIRLKRR
jgi:hypothetical protein